MNVTHVVQGTDPFREIRPGRSGDSPLHPVQRFPWVTLSIFLAGFGLVAVGRLVAVTGV